MARLIWIISCVSDECGSFVRWECVQEGSNPSPCFLDGSCLGLADERLELGEHHLDRVEIGTVWRQEEEMGTGVSDCLSGGGAFLTPGSAPRSKLAIAL